MSFSSELQEAIGASCPLLTLAYGGMPTSGGFTPYTMMLVAAGHIAEAAHCILGVLTLDEQYQVEPSHVRDELKVIEKWMSRGGNPDQMNNPTARNAEFVREGIAHAKKQAPKLKRRATQMLDSLKRQHGVPVDVMKLAEASYRVLIALSDALLKALASKPITDAIRDPMLVQAVARLKQVSP